MRAVSRPMMWVSVMAMLLLVAASCGSDSDSAAETEATTTAAATTSPTRDPTKGPQTWEGDITRVYEGIPFGYGPPDTDWEFVFHCPPCDSPTANLGVIRVSNPDDIWMLGMIWLRLAADSPHSVQQALVDGVWGTFEGMEADAGQPLERDEMVETTINGQPVAYLDWTGVMDGEQAHGFVAATPCRRSDRMVIVQSTRIEEGTTDQAMDDLQALLASIDC